MPRHPFGAVLVVEMMPGCLPACWARTRHHRASWYDGDGAALHTGSRGTDLLSSRLIGGEDGAALHDGGHGKDVVIATHRWWR
jgi:hypothetical protein